MFYFYKECLINKQLMKIIFTLLAALFLMATSFAQVGINNETPDASAALDITSTTGGLLVPRMTASQRNLITSPTQGLIIFCTDCASGEGELQVRLASSWKNTSGGEVNDPPPAVGDFYQGGVVFYLFESGDMGYVEGEIHGLIAAAEDQYRGNNDSYRHRKLKYGYHYICTRRYRNLCSRTGKSLQWRRIYRLVFTFKRWVK